MKPLLLLSLIFSLPLMSSAIEKAFPQTSVGQYEIKTLPAARLIASQTDKTYFDGNNGLFRPLFRYISAKDISMTTPVEAEIEPGVMYFYIGSDVDDAVLESTNTVKVVEMPARKVASIGVRGSYNESNFKEARRKLEKWLDDNEDYTASADARGVFWNGPFVPGFMKKFEVHIPVEPRAE